LHDDSNIPSSIEKEKEKEKRTKMRVSVVEMRLAV
jgi:hypothetical protein